MQDSLVLIKPDGLKKGLAGEVLGRLQRAGYRIVGAKMVKVSDELAHEHYGHLKDQPFYKELIEFITGRLHGDPDMGVLALVVRGEDVIAGIREIAGATHPEKADPMSVRGAFGRITTAGVMENVMHASSEPSEAEREIKLWFKPEEIIDPAWSAKSNGGGASAWA